MTRGTRKKRWFRRKWLILGQVVPDSNGRVDNSEKNSDVNLWWIPSESFNYFASLCLLTLGIRDETESRKIVMTSRYIWYFFIAIMSCLMMMMKHGAVHCTAWLISIRYCSIRRLPMCVIFNNFVCNYIFYKVTIGWLHNRSYRRLIWLTFLFVKCLIL